MNFTNSIVTDYSLAKDVTGDRVEVIENSGKDIRFEQHNGIMGCALVYTPSEVREQENKFNLCSSGSLNSSIDLAEHTTIEFKEVAEDEAIVTEVESEVVEEEPLEQSIETLNGPVENVEHIENVGPVEESAQEESKSELRTLEEEVQPEESQIVMVDQSSALLEIAEPDESYTGAIVTLTDEDRYILERLVMGESGGEGFEGAALVAQCIRDTMVYDGIGSVEEVRNAYKYSGKLIYEPNQNVLDAVRYIFDEGGVAVKHRVQFFYAPKLCNGTWHETQHFIIEHGGHKFFAKW